MSITVDPRKPLYKLVTSEQETCLEGSIISLVFVQMDLTVKQALAVGRDKSLVSQFVLLQLSSFCCAQAEKGNKLKLSG